MVKYHSDGERKGKEMFYLTTHSTHFNYGYMASDIWLWTILIVRKETHCRHMGYSFRLTARVILYAPSHRQDSTYHGLCYTNLVFWRVGVDEWDHSAYILNSYKIYIYIYITLVERELTIISAPEVIDPATHRIIDSSNSEP